MRKKRNRIPSARAASIVLDIISAINKGDTPETIKAAIVAQYNISPRTVDTHLQRARSQIAKLTEESVEIARGIWRARIEQQYRDTYAIDDIDKRLRRQEAITALGIKLSGADTMPPRSMQIFHFFPVEHQSHNSPPIEADFTIPDEPADAVSLECFGSSSGRRASLDPAEDGDNGVPVDEGPIWAMRPNRMPIAGLV